MTYLTWKENHCNFMTMLFDGFQNVFRLEDVFLSLENHNCIFSITMMFHLGPDGILIQKESWYVFVE